MRVIRWKNAVTGVESLNITATGIYFPVGKTDSSFIARYSMASAGQTASVERVSSPNGSRVGSPAINVSGTTEVVVNERRGLSTGIIVTAISGTLISVLDDNTPITNFPDAGLGRFPAKEDADAYVYGSTVPQGIPATINGVPYSWGGAGWVLAGDIGPGSPSTPFTTIAERTAWATANMSLLRSGASTVWGPGNVEYRFVGPEADKFVLAQPMRQKGAGKRVMCALTVPQTTYAGYSWQLVVALPGTNISALRFALAASATGETTYAGVVGMSQTLSHDLLTTSPRATWRGQTTKTIPQSKTYTALVAPDIHWSDWIPVKPVVSVGGVAYAIIRVYTADTNVMCAGYMASTAPQESAPLPYATRWKLGDFVTANQDGFSSPANPGCCPIFAVEYVSDDSVFVEESGDSIRFGYKTTIQGNGPLNMATKSLCDSGVLVSPANQSIAGAHTARSSITQQNLRGSLRGIEIIQSYTRNGYGFPYTFADKVMSAISFGNIPIVVSGIYESTTPTSNALMLTSAAYAKSWCEQRGIIFIDLSTLITADNAATMLDADGIHPGDVGTAAIATLYASAIQLVISGNYA